MYSFASFILTISLHDALPIFHLLGSNDPLDIVALLDDLRKRASHLCNERIEEIDQEWIAETERLVAVPIRAPKNSAADIPAASISRRGALRNRTRARTHALGASTASSPSGLSLRFR